MRLSEFVLRYRLGEGEWQTFRLPGFEIQVGRENDNHLILDHREVSRHHLQIRFDEGGFLITDLGSINGTQVDGITLTPQIPMELRPGQMIQVGDFTLVLAQMSENNAQISRELLPFLLRFRFGAGTWQTFPLEPGEKILGRNPDNDFFLNDSEVSRRHARLQIHEGEIWLTDLGSTNGTRVGGINLEPEQPYRLQLGQIFTIGNFVLQLDEPSRFYKAPSAVAGKVDRKEWEASNQTLSVVETKNDAPLPVHALNLNSKERITLGRALDNDIVIHHPMVSRYHALIERTDSNFRIQDLRSSSGVFVNDQRIGSEKYLKDWDQIRIGRAIFLLSGHDLEQRMIPGLKIEAKHINQHISPSRNLLQDISLIINPNELIALIGPNGSGKSTLLKALSGYKPASHGQVLVNEVDFYQHFDMFRNDVGYLPGEAVVHSQLTPEAALNYAAKLRLPPDTTKEERSKIISKVLENLNLIAERNVPITHLLPAQVKRVSLGVELLHRPRLLYLNDYISELDPSAEYDMVKLLRRLADQGRTIISITSAVHNLMLFDKVIILTHKGYLAYLGPPEEALNFFNPYRTDQELREKEIEFGDIYRILNDEERGTPQEWRERYLSSHSYFRVFGIDPSLAELQTPDVPQPVPENVQVSPWRPRISQFKQFSMLSSRNLRILTHDRGTLIMMLLLAPVVGWLDFIWGRNLYDPIIGDPTMIIIMWFFGVLSAIMVGSLSSYREINKEVSIYRHERWANLRILPYFFSKLWIGMPLSLYQAAVLLVIRQYLVMPNIPTATAYFAMYFTLFLTTLTGYLLGLLVSSATSKQYAAVLLIAILLILQILFAGALLPLDWIPGGKQISVFMPARWSYESLVRMTGLGDQLNSDPCWTGYNETDRFNLSEIMKQNCPCMGADIFKECANFPGIFSEDFYDEAAIIAFMAPEPVAPMRPTEIPSPTPFPSPTSFPTPNPIPSLTPLPTPRVASDIPAYMSKINDQNKAYQLMVADQNQEYQIDKIAQIEEYYQARVTQRESYLEVRKNQAEAYAVQMQTYSNAHAEWQEQREKTIYSAEAMIGSIFDNFRQIFIGDIKERWVYLILIQVGLAIFVLAMIKSKDRF